MENQVSIIINGVRYDAIPNEEGKEKSQCSRCHLNNFCLDGRGILVCFALGIKNSHFKKSDKKFEV